MKKYLLPLIVCVLAVTLLLVGCAKDNGDDNNQPGTGEGPQQGGTLVAVKETFPSVVGFPPEMSATCKACVLPAVESLLNYSDQSGTLTGILAEDWDEDPENNQITFSLRKGVKFHDGTPFNAEAAKWNFDLGIKMETLSDYKNIEKIEVVDEYTFRIYTKEHNIRCLPTWGTMVMISPSAFEEAAGGDIFEGDGDIEKGAEWARNNLVATGPYKLVEFNRDDVLRFEPFEDYWGEGPYLDEWIIRFVPDIMTAQAMMKSGDAQMIMELTDIDVIAELNESPDYIVNEGPGQMWCLHPDSSNPDSPLANKLIREAIEYAIDKKAIADMVGRGLFEPLTQMAPKAWTAGYVEGLDLRPYNPEKAKQLMADAGYDGEEIILFTREGDTPKDTLVAIQGYLQEVGFNVKLDISDRARYIEAIFREGWDGLAFCSSGLVGFESNFTDHYGHEPLTFKSGNTAKPDELLEVSKEIVNAFDLEERGALLKEAITIMAEDCTYIPIYRIPLACAMANNVHCDYMKVHGNFWPNPNETWVE